MIPQENKNVGLFFLLVAAGLLAFLLFMPKAHAEVRDCAAGPRTNVSTEGGRFAFQGEDCAEAVRVTSPQLSVTPVKNAAQENFWVLSGKCNELPEPPQKRQVTKDGWTIYEFFCPTRHQSLGCLMVDTSGQRTVDNWASDARAMRNDHGRYLAFNAEVIVTDCPVQFSRHVAPTTRRSVAVVVTSDQRWKVGMPKRWFTPNTPASSAKRHKLMARRR